MIIDTSKSPSLIGILGISRERAEFIMDFVGVLYDEVRVNAPRTVPLSVYYKRLAEETKTINEFAFAMHNFVFNLAAVGTPMDSKKNQN